MPNRRLFPLAVLTLLGAACRRAPAALPAVPTATPAAPTPAPPASVPDLGELMNFQQIRHAKLWWAGSAQNWKLAAYELDEIGEGFEDIVRYHPTHKDSPVPIKDAVETIMRDPLSKTRQAIEAKDSRAFAAVYDLVTDGCNACHQVTNFGFLVVKRPGGNTFANQSFAPEKPAK